MQAIDANGTLGKFILDVSRKIPKAHLDSVCKIQQGAACCRYIGLGVLKESSFVCVKRTTMKATLDELVSQEKMTAKGDNCEGIGDYLPSPEQSKPDAP